MDRKSILLVALCALVLILSNTLTNIIWPPRPLPPSAPRGTNAAPNAARAGGAAGEPHSYKPAPEPSALITQLQAAAGQSPEAAVLEDQDMAVHFQAAGGGIGRVVFKKYDVPHEPPAAINEHAPTPALSLGVPDMLDMGELYKMSLDSAGRKITAVAESPDLSVVKTFELKTNYQLSAEITIRNRSSQARLDTVEQPVEIKKAEANGGGIHTRLVTPATLAIGTASPLTHLDTGSELGFEWLTARDKMASGALYSVTEKPWYAFWMKPLYKSFYREIPTPKAAENGAPSLPSRQWVAVKNQFFTLIITPSDQRFVGIHAEALPVPRSERAYSLKDQKGIFVYADMAALHIAPGASQTFHYDIYAGPREYYRLQALGGQQELAMNYSWWTMFCKMLLGLMTWFHGLLGNWGVSIIAMTVVIKVIFWPLTNISTRSMKRMQALSPKLKEIQEKYADDMEKKNLETMKLYREYGVNPLSGCLPVLVQIPIFISLFTMLRSMVQMRGAEFLWIKDLSMPDTVARIPFPEFKFLWWDMGPIPVNPMPILMMIANVWQMRSSPTTVTDRSQKMMMWIMPFMFFFICYNFSSALALYWTVQTLLQAAQTALIKNKPDEPLEKVKRPQFSGMTFGRPVEKKKKR